MTQPPASNSTHRLRMEQVRKRFGATIALAGVDLAVNAGEVHALIGENGAGKSTLMKVLSGALQPDDGRMWLDDQPYRPQSPADGRASGVAMVYQELSLAQHLSVMENILLGMEPTAGPLVRWGEIRRTAAEAMQQVGHEDIPLDAPVAQLSTAEQQLVEIARSMAVGCRVLVLDEPTSSLTRKDIERLFTLIRRLKDQGHAIVYISHFLEEVQEISDTFTVLRDGETVGRGVTDESEVGQIINMMVGREVKDLYPRSDRQRGESVLEINNLAGRDRPSSASLELHRGEVVGIAGLVGAGRTEMMRAIFGLDPVLSGEVRVGTYRGGESPRDSWLRGVGMVSEDRKYEGLALGLSIAENITLPRLRGLGPWRFVTPGGQDRASAPHIQHMPIKCTSPRQQVDNLSGGNQQKVAVARLLHADVDVLLLDEPTRGIDVGSKAQIYQLIDELTCGAQTAGAKPKAVLMISSYLPELLGICDRIAVMHRGRLGPCRPVEEVDEHSLMLAATGVEEIS